MGGSNSAEAPKEDEDPPVNVDTGDSVKVKQTLDEAVVKAVLDHGYEEHHTLDNAKLLLMLVACSFAMVAQFWPIPFPKSRPLLGVWMGNVTALTIAAGWITVIVVCKDWKSVRRADAITVDSRRESLLDAASINRASRGVADV